MVESAAKHTTITRGSNPATPLSKNEHLLRWVEKMAELTKPARIHWVDGSQEENQLLLNEMVQAGTLVKLNEDHWPGCYYARSDAVTLPAWKTEPSSVLFRKTAPGPRTTGKTLTKCANGFADYLTARCVGEPCTSSASAWVHSGRRCRKSASNSPILRMSSRTCASWRASGCACSNKSTPESPG